MTLKKCLFLMFLFPLLIFSSGCDSAEDWFEEGNNLYNQDRYEEAADCYQKALAINPYYADAWVNRGVCFFAMRNFEEALPCYNKALELDYNQLDA